MRDTAAREGQKDYKMPKETVSNDNQPFRTQVCWGPIGGVQIGVTTNETDNLLLQLLGDYCDEVGKHLLQFAIENPVIQDVTLLDDVSPSYTANIGAKFINELCLQHIYGGVWADLSREDCNRLIKILRRARDTSFGRDE